MLPADLRTTLAGFVLNKFRGDAALLAPGPGQLQALTGVPVVGVLPMRRDHGLPDEDGVSDAGAAASAEAGPGVAIVAYPRISNLDEFQPLRHVPGLRLRWARHVVDLDGANWIVLPGSKQVSGDLRWLRERGLVLGVCVHGLFESPALMRSLVRCHGAHARSKPRRAGRAGRPACRARRARALAARLTASTIIRAVGARARLLAGAVQRESGRVEPSATPQPELPPQR